MASADIMREVTPTELKRDNSKSNDETAFTKFAFPFKLHQILDAADKEGFDNIITWLPDGKSFQIHDQKKFTDNIMPEYFGQCTKYRSFQRQLNIYGFERRDKQARRHTIYFHKLFIRGKSHLCTQMTRERIKGCSKQAPTKPSWQGGFVESPFASTTTPPHILLPFLQATQLPFTNPNIISLDKSTTADWMQLTMKTLSAAASLSQNSTQFQLLGRPNRCMAMGMIGQPQAPSSASSDPEVFHVEPESVGSFMAHQAVSGPIATLASPKEMFVHQARSDQNIVSACPTVNIIDQSDCLSDGDETDFAGKRFFFLEDD